MESKLIHRKWFLYLTEFFAGMSIMAVELGATPASRSSSAWAPSQR